MNQKTTGGPAFPTAEFIHDEVVHTGGMTLRDYFAAKAMQGLLAANVQASTERFAESAYKMADGMLKARGTA